MQNATVIGINPQLAVLAARLGKQYKLPMADSIIYATAVLWDTELYTQDKHFENLARVHYFSK
jgi:predicted nucleic acid-binding protein